MLVQFIITNAGKTRKLTEVGPCFLFYAPIRTAFFSYLRQMDHLPDSKSDCF